MQPATLNRSALIESVLSCLASYDLVDNHSPYQDVAEQLGIDKTTLNAKSSIDQP